MVSYMTQASRKNVPLSSFLHFSSINYTLCTGCLLPNSIVAMVLLLLYKYTHSTLLLLYIRII